jgi:hypothetical protein
MAQGPSARATYSPLPTEKPNGATSKLARLIIRSRLSVRKWIQEKHFGCGIVAIAGVWTSQWEASPMPIGTRSAKIG